MSRTPKSDSNFVYLHSLEVRCGVGHDEKHAEQDAEVGRQALPLGFGRYAQHDQVYLWLITQRSDES